MKAYPLLVKPFLVALEQGLNKFIWLHRAESEQCPVLMPVQESVTVSTT